VADRYAFVSEETCHIRLSSITWDDIRVFTLLIDYQKECISISGVTFVNLYRPSQCGNQFFLSSNFFLEFSVSRTSSESHSATFAKQPFGEKIVLASSVVFPTGDIIYLHSRIS
jgi:hypothetical protein